MSNKPLRLNEQQLLNIIKEGAIRVINETYQNDEFSIAMDKLYRLLKDEVGGDSLRDTIASWFWKDWDGESKIIPCEYDERGMLSLAYQLCNYDAICLNDDGSVNVKYSNVPKIAQIMKPYVTPEIGMHIVHNLYER